MKKPIQIATALAFMLLFSVSSVAREVVKSGGGDATGTGGSAGFTVGQIFYSTIEGEGGSSMQGIQQPYEIWVITSVEDFGKIVLTTTVYPNPTVDVLNLRVEGAGFDGVHYRLYDLGGRLRKSDHVHSTVTKLEMAHLSPSTYLLIVYHHNQVIKSFKILKNQ